MKTRSTAAEVKLHPPSRRSGFTLVELVASLTIGAILIGGMGSAILIASHALPGRNTTPDAILRASDVVEQISNELHCAVTFTQRTATMIEIKVPDRNADLAQETIRYAWSGTPGDPLTRQYNMGTIVNVAENVQEFDLRYDLVTTTVQTPGTLTETSNCYFVNIGMIDPTPDTGYVVSDTTWCGMCFSFNPATPVGGVQVPPPNPTSFTIDFISHRMRKAGNGPGSGVTAVQLRAADGNGLPTSTVYDEYLIDEGILPSKSWGAPGWTATNSPSFSITDVVCLVFKADSGTDTAQILFQDTTGLPEADKTTFVTSSDAGSSWTAYNDQALTQSYIYATFTASSGSTETSTYALTSVGIKLRLGMDARTRVQTAAQVLNAPEVSGP